MPWIRYYNELNFLSSLSRTLIKSPSLNSIRFLIHIENRPFLGQANPQLCMLLNHYPDTLNTPFADNWTVLKTIGFIVRTK